jgi:hypothetical protein
VSPGPALGQVAQFVLLEGIDPAAAHCYKNHKVMWRRMDYIHHRMGYTLHLQRYKGYCNLVEALPGYLFLADQGKPEERSYFPAPETDYSIQTSAG